MNRFKIGEYMAISKPRKKQICKLCGDEVGGFGLIVYLGHESYKCYTWFHPDCMKDFNPDKYPAEVFKLFSKFSQKKITSSNIACSYCGEINVDKELFNAGWFMIHPGCVKRCYSAIQKALKKHGPEIVAGAI